MSSPPVSGLFYWAHDMTQFVIANNVNTQLAASAASGATTLTLASSANLPTLSAGQVMPLTLNDAATGQNYEIVYVTAISGVTLTVTRAQEGTGALNWSIGDYAYCAPTAGTVAMTTGNPSDTFQVAAATALNYAPQAGQVQRAAFNYAGLAGGTANAITATLSVAPTSYTDYLIVTVRVASNNTGSVSLNINGLGAVPVIGQGHQTLQGGELVAGGFATFAYSTNYNEAILLEATGGPVQVAPATASQHAPQAGQVQRNAFNYGSVAGGTANALTATLTPAPTSYTDDLTVIVRVASNNTGATTLNVNGLGATTVVGAAHQALQGGELVAGGFACFAYSQSLTQFVLLWATGGAEQVAPATQSQHAVQLQQVGHGQCRLSVNSTTQLKLAPYNGNNVIVNGVPLQLPSAGVTASNSGLSASTLYYVYLGGTTASPTLSLSITGHSTASNGIETKTGDTTQTLVGMIYTNASSQFVDSVQQIFCLNWFNRRNKYGAIFGTNTSTFTNTSVSELNTAFRVSFLSWSDESVYGFVCGTGANQTAGDTVTVSYGIDGIGAPAACTFTSTSASALYSFNCGDSSFVSEGLHYATITGAVNASAGYLSTYNNTLAVRG